MTGSNGERASFGADWTDDGMDRDVEGGWEGLAGRRRGTREGVCRARVDGPCSIYGVHGTGDKTGIRLPCGK